MRCFSSLRSSGWFSVGTAGTRECFAASATDSATSESEMGDGGRPEARAYNDLGVLVRTVRGRSGVVTAPVVPGGFTVVTSGP